MTKKLDEKTVSSWVQLVRTQQILVEKMETAMKAKGLKSIGWYDVLLELDNAPKKKLRISDLGAQVLLSKSNITRLVDRMVAEGFVKREPCEEDGRGAYAVITKDGKAAKRKMWTVYQSAIAEHFNSHLNDADKKNLARVLGKLVTEDEE